MVDNKNNLVFRFKGLLIHNSYNEYVFQQLFLNLSSTPPTRNFVFFEGTIGIHRLLGDRILAFILQKSMSIKKAVTFSSVIHNEKAPPYGERSEFCT